jgi:hypothetical protein
MRKEKESQEKRDLNQMQTLTETSRAIIKAKAESNRKEGKSRHKKKSGEK